MNLGKIIYRWYFKGSVGASEANPFHITLVLVLIFVAVFGSIAVVSNQ